MYTLSAVVVSLALLGTSGSGQQERAITPEFRVHKIASLPTPRDVLVWLPPEYESEPDRRFPTLYLHDGASPFIIWRIDEIAKPLIASKVIEPLIIVLIPNGGGQQERFDEYTPTRPRNAKAGGQADAYGRALIEELKPFVDATYRTRSDAADTAMGGASLGGLVSLHIGLAHPDVFGKLAILSPSVWWDDEYIVRQVKALKSKPATRIWLDMGTKETRTAIGQARRLRDALVRKGWTLDGDLSYSEIEGATHDDEAFARRVEPMLKYLFPRE